MAKVISQKEKKGAKNLLEIFRINTSRFTPNIVAQIPISATGLLAKVNPNDIYFDTYDNPFIVTAQNERISLAAVIVCDEKIFVYNREGKDLQNLNEKLDVIGAVGFGISSGPFKWPNEMNNAKIARSWFSDYYAEEKTDGENDYETIIMPIVVIELESIEGLEDHFIDIPNIDDSQSAKLQAAIMAIKENI